MIYFTSDTHYGHSNIVRGTSNWNSPQSVRDFDTLAEHNQALVDGINSVVKSDDVLYHLGDWSFGGINNIWEFRRQLAVKDIHLILGNHDHHIEKNKVLPNCHYSSFVHNVFEVEDGANLIDKNYKGIYDVRAQELFKTVQYVLNVKVNGRRFFLSHYAHRIWDQSHHGVIHLYGHSHSTLETEPWGRSMDVGVDNAFKLLGEYRPFSITEIIDLMDKREIYFPDHHKTETN